MRDVALAPGVWTERRADLAISKIGPVGCCRIWASGEICSIEHHQHLGSKYEEECVCYHAAWQIDKDHSQGLVSSWEASAVSLGTLVCSPPQSSEVATTEQKRQPRVHVSPMIITWHPLLPGRQRNLGRLH